MFKKKATTYFFKNYKSIALLNTMNKMLKSIIINKITGQREVHLYVMSITNLLLFAVEAKSRDFKK